MEQLQKFATIREDHRIEGVGDKSQKGIWLARYLDENPFDPGRYSLIFT